MKILTVSGSSRIQSSNARLLDALPDLFPEHSIKRFQSLDQLPLFNADEDQHPWPASVLDWRSSVALSNALIICTPEYLHNLPAVLKNALEWLKSSGELFHKPVLAMSFTPHAPRGDKAMQSLLWSLQALEARVEAQVPLYQKELSFDDNGHIVEAEQREMLLEALKLML